MIWTAAFIASIPKNDAVRKKGSEDKVTKLHKAERWICLLTLIFLVGVSGYFVWQNQKRDVSFVQAEHPPESVEAASTVAPPEAPGLLPGERININTAPAEDLCRLPSIGEVRAADIVAYREQNGPFVAPEDIMNVSGIGEKTYDKLAPYISLSE